MTRILEVGQPYLPIPVGDWQDGAAVFDWRRARMELVLAVRSPTPDDVGAARQGPVFIGVAPVESLVYLTYRLQDHIGAVPYSVHLLPLVDRPGLEPLPEGKRSLLTLVLVDAGTGIIRALRPMWLGWHVEQALRTAVASQAAREWDANKYNQDLVELPDWGWSAQELHMRAIMEEAVDGAEEA